MSELPHSPADRPAHHARSAKATTAHWTRWLHVYTSMLSLLIVLFFGITGLTLNHPSWNLGGGPSTEVASGALPPGATTNGAVDFLAITEHVRSTHGVRGSVQDYGATATEGRVSFKGPGYAADLVFDLTAGTYQLTVEQQGLLGALNDLHKGRDTDPGWNWLIDVAAVFLVVVALTGLGIQISQKKRRRQALGVAGTFGVLAIVAIVIALR